MEGVQLRFTLPEAHSGISQKPAVPDGMRPGLGLGGALSRLLTAVSILGWLSRTGENGSRASAPEHTHFQPGRGCSQPLLCYRSRLARLSSCCPEVPKRTAAGPSRGLVGPLCTGLSVAPKALEAKWGCWLAPMLQYRWSWCFPGPAPRTQSTRHR